MMASALIERVMEEQAFPVRHGVFVAVAGPSGAGKDTLIDLARRHFEAHDDAVTFVRRLVTRPVDEASEDHDTLSLATFEQWRSEGRFSCAWQANGLGYALPARVDDIVRSGRVAVANVSRGAICELRRRYRNFLAVIVTAPDDVLADRLAARGRETREEILARLARNQGYGLEFKAGDTFIIDNSGTAGQGGDRLIAAIDKALAWSTVCDSI